MEARIQDGHEAIKHEKRQLQVFTSLVARAVSALDFSLAARVQHQCSVVAMSGYNAAPSFETGMHACGLKRGSASLDIAIAMSRQLAYLQILCRSPM